MTGRGLNSANSGRLHTDLLGGPYQRVPRLAVGVWTRHMIRLPGAIHDGKFWAAIMLSISREYSTKVKRLILSVPYGAALYLTV